MLVWDHVSIFRNLFLGGPDSPGRILPCPAREGGAAACVKGLTAPGSRARAQAGTPALSSPRYWAVFGVTALSLGQGPLAHHHQRITVLLVGMEGGCLAVLGGSEGLTDRYFA